MIDGFDIRYYDPDLMPVMNEMVSKGFFKIGSSIFPSLTNANNISIACGCWPDEHGVTTNCYYDEKQDKAVFLEHPEFLTTQTLFERAELTGSNSALLTCKAKTTKILRNGVCFSVAAENPDSDIIEKYGKQPPMYSSEINYWLCDIALDLLISRKDIDLIYLHTTDYPMHMWPPDAPESRDHMKNLDTYLGKFLDAAPEYTIGLTADHGMNYKKRCWDLAKACRNRGADVKFSISPVADRLLKHHRGFGGVAYVHLNSDDDKTRVKSTLLSLTGVETVLEKEEAAERYNLMESRIGDLIVLPDIDTVFGDLPQESEELASDYRSHGSLYEMQIPLLIYNYSGIAPRYKDINHNIDVSRFLFDQV